MLRMHSPGCIIALLLSLVWITSCTHTADGLTEIKQRKEIRVAMEPGFLPFGMKKPNGEWVGFDIDMINAFADFIGVRPVFLDIKWDGAIPALIAKKFELIVNSVTITDERKKTVAFTDPYYRAGLTVLLAKKNRAKVASVSALDDPRYTVAVQLGTTGDIYASKHLKNAKIIQMDSSHDASNAVLFGRVDAFINDKPMVALFAKKHPGKVFELTTPLNEEYFGVVARKQDHKLVEEFNRFLKHWKSSGGYANAVKRNFEEMIWKDDLPELHSAAN